MSSDRVSKPLLVSKLVQVVKSNTSTKKPIFKSFEFGSIEAGLRDDIFKYNWVYHAIYSIVNECYVASPENIQLYNTTSLTDSYNNDKINEDLISLKDELELLRRRKDYLSKRMNKLNEKENENTNETENVQLTLQELKLKQCVSSLDKVFTKTIQHKDPKLYVNNIQEKLNNHFRKLHNLQLDEILDDLAMSSTNNTKLHSINSLKMNLFELKNKLALIEKECKKQLNYYKLLSKCEVDLKLDLKKLINESKKNSCLGVKKLDFIQLHQNSALFETLEVPKYYTPDQVTRLISELEMKIQCMLEHRT